MVSARRLLTLLLGCVAAQAAAADPVAPQSGDSPEPGAPRPSSRTVGVVAGPPAAPAPNPVSARPAMRLETLEAGTPAANDSWIGWQRATDGGREHWSAQVFVRDDRSTVLGLECQTAKPVKPGGVNDLPALLPAVTWSQEVLRGLTVQGSVGQNAPVSWRTTVDELKIQPRYNVSVQLTPESALRALPGWQLSVETTGKTTAPAASADPAPQWDLAPTLRWQTGTNCSLSGGMLMPIERGRSTPDTWRFNWSWQY